MLKRIMHIFRNTKKGFMITTLVTAVTFGGCVAPGTQETGKNGPEDTVLEKEVSSETKTASNVSIYETVLQTAAEGYEAGLAEALKESETKKQENTSPEEEMPSKDEESDDSLKDKAENNDLEVSEDKKYSLDTEEAAEAVSDAGNHESSDQDSKEALETAEAEVKEDSKTASSEKKNNELSDVSTENGQKVSSSQTSEEELNAKSDEPTYYDLEKQSDETYQAVRDTVIAETGGNAGFLSSYQLRVMELVNEERVRCGLSTLEWDSGAQQVAAIRAMEIVSCGSHTRPNGGPWYSVFGDYNIQPIPSGAGENIAGGQVTPDEVIKGWFASSPHYGNIIRPEFTGMAVACYYDPESSYKFYWVQTFVTR